MSSPHQDLNLGLTLAVGLAVFVLGLGAAWTSLPEWRQEPLPEPAFFAEKLERLLARSGLKAPSWEPRFALTTHRSTLRDAYRRLGGEAPARLAEEQRAVSVEVTFLARWEDSPLTHAQVVFSGTGTPWVFTSTGSEWRSYLPGDWPEDRSHHGRALAGALAGTEVAELGEPARAASPSGPMSVYTVPGAADHSITVAAAPNWVTSGERHLGTVAEIREETESTDFTDVLLMTIPVVGRFLLVTLVFLGLAFKRRLGSINAAILAALVFLFCFGAAMPLATSLFLFSLLMISVLVKTVFVFILWSSAESWARSIFPGFSTSLDALRSARIGPRSGRSLLGGWALGILHAGAVLILFALAARLPGVYPGDLSVPLPVFTATRSPLGTGVLNAGLALLALALSRTVFSARWVGPVAILLAGVLNLPQVDLEPWPFGLLASIALNAILIFTFQRFGLTGLLTASIVGSSMPAAVFSALHVAWMPWTFAATALFCLAVPLVGWSGLSRPKEPELERIVAPAYIRRLEEERRIRYEMDLLARMQKGLLPAATPDVEGYQVAATSILAHEAGGDLYDFFFDEEGGFWIAAGDVSGHGLSCTIEHAMTKAALLSLVKAGRRPSEILHDVDRVLRAARSVRSFTSMSLLRLEPPTGEVVFSNAGHPYPLLLNGQDLSEISLPSLPLGQGPQREYFDQTVALREGSVLVLLSDGLFESPDAAGRAYGYPRTRLMLVENVHRPAREILDTLIGDWRRHIGPGSPADDTTLVVLKRD